MDLKKIEDMASWLDEVADELNALAEMDPMEMYRYLSSLGNGLIDFGEPEKISSNFVQGCTSNVYIEASVESGLMRYKGSSEALVVRGYVAILVHALSGLRPHDVCTCARPYIEDFAEKTRIRATLTPSRANAFGSIFRLMEEKARIASVQ